MECRWTQMVANSDYTVEMLWEILGLFTAVQHKQRGVRIELHYNHCYNLHCYQLQLIDWMWRWIQQLQQRLNSMSRTNQLKEVEQTNKRAPFAPIPPLLMEKNLAWRNFMKKRCWVVDSQYPNSTLHTWRALKQTNTCTMVQGYFGCDAFAFVFL